MRDLGLQGMLMICLCVDDLARRTSAALCGSRACACDEMNANVDVAVDVSFAVQFSFAQDLWSSAAPPVGFGTIVFFDNLCSALRFVERGRETPLEIIE